MHVMRPRRPKGFWYLPGRLYDLAFSAMFRGLRAYVARTVEKEDLYPWLDVCSGTGAQLGGNAQGRPRVEPTGGPGGPVGGNVPLARFPDLSSAQQTEKPVFGLDLSFAFVRYAAARAPGVPFVCGNAARLPFRNNSMRAVSVSFGLHDKSPAIQSGILQEARRVMSPLGRLIAVDFERPWDGKSRLGALFVRAIERLASREHCQNGREFLRRGGLRGLLQESGFVEVSRRDVSTGSLSIVVARPL